MWDVGKMGGNHTLRESSGSQVTVCSRTHFLSLSSVGLIGLVNKMRLS